MANMGIQEGLTEDTKRLGQKILLEIIYMQRRNNSYDLSSGFKEHLREFKDKKDFNVSETKEEKNGEYSHRGYFGSEDMSDFKEKYEKTGKIDFDIPEKQEKLLSETFAKHGIKYRLDKVDEDRVRITIASKNKKIVYKAMQDFIKELEKDKEKYEDVKNRAKSKKREKNKEKGKEQVRNKEKSVDFGR